MAEGLEPIIQEPIRTDTSSINPSPSPPRSNNAPSDPHPRGSEPPPTRPLKGHALTALLALGFGMVGAFAYSRFVDEPKRPADAADADPETSPGEEYAGPSVKDLAAQVSKLVEQVDGLGRRLNALPRPEPPPDLSDLQVRVADLTKATEEIAPLRGVVKRIDHRIDAIDQSVRSLGDDVRGISLRHEKAAQAGDERSGPGPSPRHAAEDLGKVRDKLLPDEVLAQGAALFRQHKYKEASDTFSKMELEDPDDARIWYYAALAHGFATKQWNEDGAGRLAQKGIERERMGTPPKVVIDETFKDLTSATGKDWLAAYRGRVNDR